MSTISYKKLEDEVWNNNICSGCGACVSVCPADALYFSDNSISPVSSGYCKRESDLVTCGSCYSACPRTGMHRNSSLLGDYIKICGGTATGNIPHRQNGGAVTAILSSALKTGMIDGVITVAEDNYSKKPYSVLITDEGSLVKVAGTRYNWSVPVLSALKSAVIDRKLKKLAIVGTPCVVSAARKIKNSDNDLLMPFGRSIRLIMGLFCTECFDYRKLMQEILVKGKSIDPARIEHMNVKGKLEIQEVDGTTTNIKLDEIKDAIRPGCLICEDFSAIDSDISSGSVGTSEKITTLIIRNSIGMNFVELAMHSMELTCTKEYDILAIERLAERKRK